MKLRKNFTKDRKWQENNIKCLKIKEDLAEGKIMISMHPIYKKTNVCMSVLPIFLSTINKKLAAEGNDVVSKHKHSLEMN